MTKRLTITIDGPAGAGKSTVARRVAERLGYTYVDTGAMYRAVALQTRRLGISPQDEEGMARLLDETSIVYRSGKTLLNGEDVSRPFAHPATAAHKWPDPHACILSGMSTRDEEEGHGRRDVGTIILPEAELKIFDRFLSRTPAPPIRVASWELRLREEEQESGAG